MCAVDTSKPGGKKGNAPHPPLSAVMLNRPSECREERVSPGRERGGGGGGGRSLVWVPSAEGTLGTGCTRKNGPFSEPRTQKAVSLRGEKKTLLHSHK